MQGSRGCIPGSPGESGLVSRGSQGLRSPLESRRGSLGPQRPAGSTHSSTRGLRPPEQLERNSALLSSRDAGLLEPPERPQGSPASSSVWREDPGLLSRPCISGAPWEVPSGPLQKSREMRVSCNHSRKTSIVLLQSVLRPLSPLWTREQ